MLRLIEGLDPSWIPSDVSALSEKGRKVAEGKRESVMKDLSWSFSSKLQGISNISILPQTAFNLEQIWWLP